ncbi:ATP-binding protein [Actinoplanes sp. NPDC023714]|uniref:sensor histidine kinase n=1 Tax=Actinoplanes sp. NPDC023714 TaxID=3154322 RepID=UPI0033E70C4C
MKVDDAVLGDPDRLAAVQRARRTLPARPIPMDAIARLAARLLNTPMATVNLVGREEEFFAGSHGLPAELSAEGRAPIAYSVCKYVVMQDHPVPCADMAREGLGDHPMATAYGVRAFLGVPIRDEDDRLLGSMTVLDTGTRQWTDDEVVTLLGIAELLHEPAPAMKIPEEMAFQAALLDTLSVGVIACDQTGRVAVMNRVLREIQGLPDTGPLPSEYGPSVEGILHDAGMRPLPWEQTPLMRAFHGEHVEAVDILCVLPGQPIRTFATSAEPIEDPAGRIIGAVAVAHELTAMRRVERFRACHLAVQEALRSAETETAAVPAVLRAVGAALGWPCAELFLIDEATGRLDTAGHWHVSGGERVLGTEISARVWQTGRALWVPDAGDRPELHDAGIRSVLAVPVRDGDTLLGVLSCYAGTLEQHEELLTVLLDGVAAQIGMYLALRRAEQVTRQLTRAQDDFIALVGHEMRTPLTSISANVTLLGEEAGGLDDDSRQMLRSVARNTSALQALVNKLLDLAGLDSGYLRLALEPLDLTALVADAVSAARHHAADTGVLLRPELPVPVRIRGDPCRLRQVVDDLLANAVRYSPLGGRVRIEVRVDDGRVEEGWAELRIADTGIGTPAEERERVFDRFFRGSNVRHQGTPGSGLGLSLAHTIVRLHGGTIRLTENQPSGTVVTVRLPCG